MSANYDVQQQKHFLMVKIKSVHSIDKRSNLINNLLGECKRSRIKKILMDVSGCDQVTSHSFRFEISKFFVLNHKNEYQLAICLRDFSSRSIFSGLTKNLDQHSNLYVSHDLNEAKSWLGVA